MRFARPFLSCSAVPHAPGRGFTLVELMVSLTVASIISALATSAVASLIQQGNRTQFTAKADAEAKIIVDAITSKYQQAAGGAYRPHHVMVVDQNCSTIDIDALTLPDCDQDDRVHQAVFADVQLGMEAIGADTLHVTDENAAGDCIFDGDASSFLNKTVVVLRSASTTAAGTTAFATRVVQSANDTTCVLGLGTTPAGYESEKDINITNYGAGTVVLGHVETLFRDSSDNILKMVRPNSAGIATLSLLTPGVFDFQVRFGFDEDGDQLVETFTGSVASATTASALRSVQVGLIIGSGNSSFKAPKKAQIMDGPLRTITGGFHLRPAVSTVGFRNIFLFY